MIESLFTPLAIFCARRSWMVVVVTLLASLACGVYVVRNLSMDTNTATMIADDLPWKKELARYNSLFPTNSGLLVIVIDGETPDLAEDGATALTDALGSRQDLFQNVRRPDGGPFFDRYGLMFLSLGDLTRVAQSIIRAQPFIASLAADPSARGLFDMLGLALTGISAGAGDIDQLLRPMQAISQTIGDVFAGKAVPLSWRKLMIDQPLDEREYRKIILAQPIRDFRSLRSGAKASDYVRTTAKDLGLVPARGVTVRLTGPVALNDEEFATVADGTSVAVVVSATLVLALLFMALRGFKPVVAGYLTLAIGLVFTLGFATAAIGSLNLISVAFVVMFIGLSIDFSIQFSVRMAQERFLADDQSVLARTARGVVRPLLLAAVATAGGFLSFIPTDYRGVSELGLIAGAGMAITFILNVTLLPALLQILRPSGKPLDMGYGWTVACDRFMQRRKSLVILAWGLPAVFGVGSIFTLTFDFNPLHLKDSSTESVATIRDLMRDPARAPYNIEIVAHNLAEADQLAAQLSAMPEVHLTATASRFIPDRQKEKLAIIADAADLLGLSLDPFEVAPTPSAAQVRESMVRVAAGLRALGAPNDTARQLARLLDQAAKGDEAMIAALNEALIGSLPGRLRQLRESLSARAIDVDSLPPEIRRDWIAESGEARLAVFPTGNSDDNAVMTRFVNAVRSVAPNATGPAVQILESGLAVAHSFRTASLLAIAAMAGLLFWVLRRAKDVCLVLAPLFAAALVTALLCRLAGLELNFANVIALPLLLGIGVAFNIYFVINWRAGVTMPLGTSTARAVLFSALTTAASFGSLAASSHPGTAGMGLLLLIGLGVILATTFTLLPALLAAFPTSKTAA